MTDIIAEFSDNGFGFPVNWLDDIQVTNQKIISSGTHFKKGIGTYNGLPCYFFVEWKNGGRSVTITTREETKDEQINRLTEALQNIIDWLEIDLDQELQLGHGYKPKCVEIAKDALRQK